VLFPILFSTLASLQASQSVIGGSMPVGHLEPTAIPRLRLQIRRLNRSRLQIQKRCTTRSDLRLKRRKQSVGLGSTIAMDDSWHDYPLEPGFQLNYKGLSDSLISDLLASFLQEAISLAFWIL
jgi:hypothetical protein